MRVALLGALISSSILLVRASSHIRQKSHGEIIDLSYQTHLDTSKINSLLLTKFQSTTRYESNGPTKLMIDVSASSLGDKGLLSILDSLLESQDGNEPTTMEVSLEARMNHLSPTGASIFLERIMNLNGVLNTTNVNNATDAMEVIESGDDQDATIGGKCLNLDGDGLKTTIYIDALDIGLNHIGIGHGRTNKKAASEMHKSLRKLVENESECCPRVLRMDACGLGAPSCRAIGKGLINRQNHVIREPKRSLRKLYLGGNSGIGDGGVAALAAALRTIPSSGEGGDAILDELDLSACGVGDAGVGALAMAIESNPGCVKRLDLSNNDISDEGIIAFSKGLINGYQNSKMCCMDSLDISNNVDIGDEGAEALFDALECGAIRSISLRSCSIRWRGVVALGTSLGNMFGSEMKDDARPRTIEIDLSGNCIGKEEKKKKKKASVQTNMMNSMSFIGKRLKSGLKDVGLSSMMMGSSMESDDEAELMDSMGSEFADDQASMSRCGAAELYTILSQDIDTSSKTRAPTTKNKVKLGMRMCNFDERGIDAIGASCVLFGDHANVQLCVDCEMNGNACEDKSIASALLNGDFKNNLLIELAKRHVEVTDGYNDFDEDYSDDFGEDSYDREYYH